MSILMAMMVCCLLIHSLIFSIPLVQGWIVHTSPPNEHLLNRKSGENLMVVCSIEGLTFDTEPDASIDWYKYGHNRPIGRMGRVMTLTKGKALSKQIMFVKPTVDDSGVYRCAARALGGEMQEKSINISFIRAAEFVDAQREQHPQEGQDAEIVCHVSGDPSLEIFWQFNGNNIAEGGPRGYEFRDNNQVLFIPQFESEQDDGEYLCNAAQFSSFETLAINVTAYAPPEITVFEGPEFGRGYEGHSAQIQCQAVGKPKPEYKWHKNVDNLEEEIVASDKYLVENGLLIIHSLIPSDGGVYTCVASNVVDEKRHSINLTIFKRPRIKKMHNVTRERGDSVDLRCSFTGDGVIKAKWVHQGEEWTLEGDQQEVRSEEYTDKDDGASITTIKGDDTRESDLQNETANKDDGHFDKLKQEDSRTLLRAEEGAIVLSIESLGEDDAGLYQCVAENEAGSDRRSIYLAITHEPTITGHSDTQRALAGSTVELSCEASAVPDPVWTWSGPQGVIEADGTSRIIHSEGTFTKLMIAGTDESDYGTYTCTAENGIGSAVRAQIDVMQIFIPDTPSEVNCHEHIYPNFATCRVDGFSDADEGHRPTQLIFYYAKDTEVDRDFPWQFQAKNVTVPFAVGTAMRISGLEPKSRYTVRVQALNEAGESDFSESDFIETTDPWAPETPQVLHSECLKVCTLSWRHPNDHGSPLTSYRIFVREVLSEDPREIASDFDEVQLNADQTSIDLKLLKPLRKYEIRLVAVNDVGNSNPYMVILNTSEYTNEDQRGTTISSTRIILTVGFVLLFVLLVVDVICFATNRCGLLACFCINCLGRNISSSKGKDIERGSKSAESNRLLSEGRTEVEISARARHE
uniref:Neural cell adhesion molecule 1 n=1 Tax=Ascaris suum TaxID=6253 RepID=F1KSA8_ASCSU